MDLSASLDRARKAHARLDPLGSAIKRAAAVRKSLAVGAAGPVPSAGGSPDPSAGTLTVQDIHGGAIPSGVGSPKRRRRVASGQTTKAEPGPAKVAVAVVMDANGNVLTVRQPDGSLAMPGGWLLDGEDPGIGAARECREETGFPASPVRVLFIAADEDGNVSAAVECQLQGNQGVPDRGEVGQVAWLPPADLMRETKYPKFNSQAIAAVSGERAAKKMKADGSPKVEADGLEDPILLIFQGLTICIDRPAGFTQTKLGPDGQVAWTRTYTTNYGYLPDTCGGDDDELDCFVAPDTSAETVWWFAVLNEAGGFDEYKLVFGAATEELARGIILAHIPPQYVAPQCASTTVSQIMALIGKDLLDREAALASVSKSLEGIEPITMSRTQKALGSVLKLGPTYEGAKPLPSEMQNHPALTAPMTELYPSPADVGGWVGVIDGGDWIAFVGEGGKSLLWTEREADGGVIGVPFEFVRDDWQAAVEDAKRSLVVGVEKADKKPGIYVTLRASSSGYDCLKELLEKLNKLGAPGHSFGIIADESTTGYDVVPKKGEKIPLGFWDGDGGASVEIESVERVEKPRKSFDHTQQLKDGWHAYSKRDGSHLGGPYATKEEAERVRDEDKYTETAQKRADLRIVTKAAPESELHYVLGVVLEPEVVDLQGEVYSAEVVRESAWTWTSYFVNFDLMHKVYVPNTKIRVVESYIAPVDFEIEGQKIKAGTWLVGAVIEDDELWAAVKRGELNGWSINGMSRGEAV